MSADLLRRAATRLQESAVAAEVDLPRATSHAAVDWPDAMTGWLGGPIGEYAALVHPPVALALARLFDVHAALLEVDREAGEHFTSAFAAEELFAVARAVLREPEGGDRT